MPGFFTLSVIKVNLLKHLMLVSVIFVICSIVTTVACDNANVSWVGALYNNCGCNTLTPLLIWMAILLYLTGTMQFSLSLLTHLVTLPKIRRIMLLRCGPLHLWRSVGRLARFYGLYQCLVQKVLTAFSWLLTTKTILLPPVNFILTLLLWEIILINN